MLISGDQEKVSPSLDRYGPVKASRPIEIGRRRGGDVERVTAGNDTDEVWRALEKCQSGRYTRYALVEGAYPVIFGFPVVQSIRYVSQLWAESPGFGVIKKYGQGGRMFCEGSKHKSASDACTVHTVLVPPVAKPFLSLTYACKHEYCIRI